MRHHRHRIPHRPAAYLGVARILRPTCNTYGSIATVDYLLESVSATSVLLAGLGRFVQDQLLWSSAEFNYLRLGDGFVQSSSIMPQKRNPVALEHARAIGSKAFGQAQAIFTSVHNTPFGDIVDTETTCNPWSSPCSETPSAPSVW
ncbi:MAG: lyase family protein [Ignavibacteriota bacterium]